MIVTAAPVSMRRFALTLLTLALTDAEAPVVVSLRLTCTVCKTGVGPDDPVSTSFPKDEGQSWCRTEHRHAGSHAHYSHGHSDPFRHS